MKSSWSLSRLLRAALVVAAVSVAGHSAAYDRELTESPDFRVRVQAALRLGRVGAPARADLEQGLRDTHPAVRVACAGALGTIGDPSSIPALERAVRAESSSTVKTAMQETVDKLRAGANVKSASSNVTAELSRARYVVQLGTMKNLSGVRADDLDAVMRGAARAKAGTIKGALIIDGLDPALAKRAAARKIPVLQVDANLTKLTQVAGRDGATTISAKVDMSIRKLPGQTLRGTVSGSASGTNGARSSAEALADLRQQVVSGAVESAMGTMGAELAAFAK